MRTRLPLLGAALALLAACEPAGQDDVIAIDADGVVQGVVFRDLDVSASLTGPDEPANDLPLGLVVAGTADTVAFARTNPQGFFSFALVPVGSYEVVVRGTALGDSMVVAFRDPPGLPVGSIGSDDTTAVTIGVDDTASVTIGIAYPVITVEEARALPTGRRVLVRGAALNVIGSVGDTSLYLQGDTRAIRATRASGDVAISDSVLVLATTATRDGQPVLTATSVFIEGNDAGTDTAVVSAARASDADAGLLDAQLVSLSALTVADTTRSSGRFVMTAEDPAGTVRVTVPVSGIDPAWVPGIEIDVIGILVPQPGQPGVWEVRPRSASEIVIR